jgi:hypothetical protein
MKRGGPYLGYPQAVQHLLHESTRSSGPGRCAALGSPKRQKTLVTRAAATVDASCVYLWPLGDAVHGDQEVSAPALALRGGSCHVCGDPVEWCPDIVLVHQAPTLGSGTPASCAGITLLAPSLDVARGVQLVVLLSDFV